MESEEKTYLLWDPQAEQFVRKTEKEVANSRQAVVNGLTEEEQEEKTKRERRDSFALVYELPEWADPEDWEAFQAEAIRCSEELCPGGVSNLTFEKSHTEDGCDLYGYSFEYDTGEEILEYVDFFKFDKANMAEVIGVREQEPNTVLVNTVRYMAASRAWAEAMARLPM